MSIPRLLSTPKTLCTTLLLALSLLTGSVALAQSPTVRISGAGSNLESNIRAHLRITSESCASSMRRLNRLLPQVRRNVERASQALGFYDSEIDLAFEAGDGCWILNVDITPGQRIRISEVRIEIIGTETRIFREVIDSPPLQRGQPLNHSQYERIKSLLSSLAAENGYFNARFNRSDLAIDLEAYTAAVLIEFEPGERFRFGEIRLPELEELSQPFLTRFLTFESSMPYSTEQLVDLRRNLNDSQYFNQVAVTPQLSEAREGEVPVNIELGMRTRRTYTTGIGASTDAGPRVRFSYEDRYINRRGHRLTGDVLVSTQQQEPSLSYVIPLRDPASESLRLSGGFLRQETDSYISNTWRVGGSYRTLFPENWVQNIFTNFQTERSELLSTNETDRINTTVSGVNWSRTRTDDPIYPRRGWRLFGQVSGSYDQFLSDISFLQLSANAKFIESVGPGRVLLRGEIGSSFVSDVEELPISERYFTGGDQSVRGYQWNSLGAPNRDGDVVGGKNLLVGSVEYDINVVGNWNVAAFMDVGNSFNDYGDIRLRRGVGLGVRWMSPIGAIRLDVARAIDKGSYRFHITMGPDL